MGMVTPNENQSDFLPLFLCHTLLNTRVFCSTVAHQLKIHFLLQGGSLISRTQATHSGKVHTRLDKWALLNLDTSISTWWERLAGKMTSPLWKTPDAEAAAETWLVTQTRAFSPVVNWAFVPQFQRIAISTPVWKCCSAYTGVEKSNGYCMQLWDVTVKRRNTYSHKYEKPCCSETVTVILLLQMK